MDNVFRISYYRASAWSPGAKAAGLVFLVCTVLIICFLGGYFVGRLTVPTLEPIDDTLRFGPAPPTWKDAVCLVKEAKCPPSFARSPLILLSMDGFSKEYLKLKETPTIERLRRCGASPPYINSMFPTSTFPNHYSIVTGLYPAFHGIVDNRMYDPITKTLFTKSAPEAKNAYWWPGEPIWITAKKQGLRSATFFWPGSEVTGQQADYYMPYNKTTSFAERVHHVLSWLDEPQGLRPDLITLYFEEPDITGHRQGPRSPKVRDALRNVDSFVNLLMEGLYERGLIGCINLIVVSDHGMEAISCDRVIMMHRLNPAFRSEDFYSREGAVGALRPTSTNYSTSDLKVIQNKFQCKSSHTWVYLEDDVPVRWHYWQSQNPRISPVLFDVEPQWLITHRKEGMDPKYCRGGDHGYDPLDEDMWGIMVGSGPAFKKNYVGEPFLNIEIYNLMAAILKIIPSANNGTMASIAQLLKDPPSASDVMPTVRPFVLCPRSVVRHGNSSGCPFTFKKEDIPDVPVNLSLTFAIGGLPVNDEMASNWDTCLLSSTLSVTGFDMQRSIPLWKTLYMSEQAEMGDRSLLASDVKWSNDPRLFDELAPSCSRYDTQEFISEDIVQVPLIPYGLSSSSKVHIISDAVPMYKSFYESTLQFIWNKFEAWHLTYQQFNIITGPVWLNRTSSRAMTHIGDRIPTHYFFLVTFCESTCDPVDMDVLGFILPHRTSLPACWDMDKYLEKHQARVSDVESVTGLKFLSELPRETSIKLRYKLVQTSAISLSSETKSRRF